jgi:hypothetical protein
MFCTGEPPTVPGIIARFSSPGKPFSIVQRTVSCQFSPAPASTIQARGVSATSRRPMISTFSTSGLTSPVNTMLLPPPSTNFGVSRHCASACSASTSASEAMRARRWARATMPKLL